MHVSSKQFLIIYLYFAALLKITQMKQILKCQQRCVYSDTFHVHGIIPVYSDSRDVLKNIKSVFGEVFFKKRVRFV